MTYTDQNFDRWNELAESGAFATIFRLQSSTAVLSLLLEGLMEQQDDPRYQHVTAMINSLHADACALTGEVTELVNHYATPNPIAA